MAAVTELLPATRHFFRCFSDIWKDKPQDLWKGYADVLHTRCSEEESVSYRIHSHLKNWTTDDAFNHQLKTIHQ